MQQKVTQERVNPFEIFDEAHREAVRGLVYVGYLERDIEFCGHTFTLKTLRPGERAAVAVATAPWRETLAESFMWANGHVGMALMAVDGDSGFCPAASPDINAFARARLNYVTHPEKGWYQPTLDFLFDTYLSLEKEALEAMEEFQNLAKRSQQPLQSSADSLIAPDSSPEQTLGDTQPTETSSLS